MNSNLNQTDIRRIEAEKIRWLHEQIDEERLRSAATASGIPLEPLYTPDDAPSDRYLEELGFPGEYPFTRGPYGSMYRERIWTIRQYSGMATAEETNSRYKYLLERGQTGLSVALDLPTQMGYDSDDPLVEEEVGRVGVALDTLADMERLFDGIPLNRISVHFTINAPTAIILAMYLAVAEKQGVPYTEIRGTAQNDILKEYVARKAYIFPPEPSLRLVGDIISYCSQSVPNFNAISITGYHAREAGANAIQEIAYALAAAIEYVQLMVNRGVNVDEFAPHLSFHFASVRDLFEETCKIRAARRMWARIIRDQFGAQDPHSMRMRWFCGCAGTAMSPAEPLNNIIRSTLQCLVGVFAGAQAMHVQSYDEAYTIPSEEAVELSIRTQQIIAYESGVADVIDPLGGSYYVEWLTNRIEVEAQRILDEIATQGGMAAAIRKGIPQQAILEQAYKTERAINSGDHVIIGQNTFAVENATDLDWMPPLPELDPDIVKRQIARLKEVKSNRDPQRVAQALSALRSAAEGEANIMPPTLEAVRAYATVGEMTQVLREVFGEYDSPSFL